MPFGDEPAANLSAEEKAGAQAKALEHARCTDHVLRDRASQSMPNRANLFQTADHSAIRGRDVPPDEMLDAQFALDRRRRRVVTGDLDAYVEIYLAHG